MRLVIHLTTDGIYKAYLDGIPTFYGAGTTKEAAIKDLGDKLQAVLKAIGYIQKST